MVQETRKPVLVYLSDAERKQLQALADQQDRSLSAMGRLLILAGFRGLREV